MTVCKFYLEGRCTFGPKCKYEHRQPNSSELNNRIGWNNSYNQQPQAFEEKSIRTDLTKERPPWPYTVYAPAKEEQNLIEGTDISQEELRFEFFKLKSFWMYGGEMQYNQGVSQLNNVMKQKMDDVLKDMRNTMRTYLNKTRPQSGAHSSNTFGGGNTSQQSSTFRSNSGYGQPQQSGYGSNRFGNSGFGRQQQSGFGSSGYSQQSNFGGYNQQQQQQQQQQPLQPSPSPFGQQPVPGFGAVQQNGGFGGFHQQQQPQQTGLGGGIPPQSNTLGTFSSTGNPPAPAFGQTGFGSVPNTQQQNPLGQSTQNPFGTQQQPSPFGGGMQGAKPSEYFTGQVPTSPPPNHY